MWKKKKQCDTTTAQPVRKTIMKKGRCNNGEKMGKLQPSYFVGGNVKLCSGFRKLFCSSSKG